MKHRTYLRLKLSNVFWSVAFFSSLWTSALFSQQTGSANGADSSNNAAPLRVIVNRAFNVGEELSYIVRYGPIVAGSAKMSIPEIVNVNGRPCYHLLWEAWTNSFFSRFYKVEDKLGSFVDVDGIFTWRYENIERNEK